MEPEESKLNPKRIGLALSGGGFRATLFHLGVVRFLHDYNLLSRLTHIASVSGGSVISAHMAHYWSDWTSNNNETFEKTTAAVTSFIDFDVRNRILRRWPFAWFYGFLSPVSDGTLTSILAYYYQKELLKKPAPLGDCSLRTDFLVSNLNRPNDTTFFTKTGLHINGDKKRNVADVDISCSTVATAAAVAASTAFPPLFPPIRVDRKYLLKGAHIYELQPHPQYFSDGGVADNSGFRHMADFLMAGEFDFLIVSDAGGATDWDDSTNFVRSRLNTASRCLDILQSQQEDFRPALPANLHALVSIHATKGFQSGLTENQLKLLGTIRTDLDSFSKFEQWCLVNHGYQVAELTLRDKLLLTPPEHSFSPWSRLGVPVPDTDSGIEVRLHIGSMRFPPGKRPWQIPISRNDLWPTLASFLLCAVIIGLACQVLTRLVLPAAAFIAFARLSSSNVSEIKFVEPGLSAGEHEYSHRGISAQAKKTLKDAFSTLSPDPKQRVAVFEMVGELPASKGTRCRMEFRPLGKDVEDNVWPRAGKAFLVGEVPQAEYRSMLRIREISLPRDSQGKLTRDVEIPTILSGEFLVFVLLLEPAQEGVLPRVGTFQLKLR